MKWFHKKYIFLPYKCKLKTSKIDIISQKNNKANWKWNKVCIFLHFFVFWTIIDFVFYAIKISMKNLFNQLWKWILKHKKRLIYWSLVLFIGQICFFNVWWIWLPNEVFAQTNNETTEKENDSIQKKLTEVNEMSALFHKIVYVLMYPLLIVAWKLVDNSFVYWEIFGFDAVLWQLWVIVRNLSNFALGFIFIYYIFSYLIKGDKDSKIKPGKIIIKSLVAWVLIQASWFIMAALIDVSTIVTYWVWWLPLSTLKNNETSGWKNENDEIVKDSDDMMYNPYILWIVLNVDGNNIDQYQVYMRSLGWDNSDTKFISQCETFTYTKDVDDEHIEEELIVAPQMLYYRDYWKNYYATQRNMCHLDGNVYYFLFEDWNSLGWNQWMQELASISWNSAGINREDLQDEYKSKLSYYIANLKNKDLQDIVGLIQEWQILLIGDSYNWWIWKRVWKQNDNDKRFWLDVYNKRSWEEWGLPKLSNLLDGWYAWVFSSLYWSLLNAWTNLRFSSTSDEWLYVRLLNSALSLGHMVAVSIPLLVTLIVLVMRIGILWIAIVLSPVIVLIEVFFWDSKKTESILKHIRLKNLISIIFSPAIICFAISMSTVLVRIINENNLDKIDSLSEPILWWLINLNITGIGPSIWKLVVSVISIAITWFLMWAAIKASSLWETGIIGNTEKLAKSTLWWLPIVPIPWTDTAVWISTVFGKDGDGGIISKMKNNIKTQFRGKDDQALDELFNPKWAKEKAEAARIANQVSSYSTQLVWLSMDNITPEWRDLQFDVWDGNKLYFNSLRDSDKESIITAINRIAESEKREKFGKVSDIQIWWKNWKFNPITKKYE